ncbi:MAG TPA: HAMP domain-containing histidine kinase [Candidatus Borkfalkia avistercoris]|uniref:histidine kinase n=1 Tax=Candidatus Borkfalkia avistercoris TaxID=2838504 RepID=A0A9D2CX26_9FIRM|nr:HAMP domain-containing histidine kinase [Candidatus Borkfalkia avistercoris]
MKSKIFLFGTILLLIAEIIALIIFAVQTPDLSQDAVAVNEIVQTVTDDFNNMEEHRNTTALNYVVLDNSGNLLYKTQSGLSESINVAITHRDTILDITIDKTQVGKIIIYNDGTQTLQYQKQTAVIVLSVAIVIQIFICIGYTVYLYLSVIRPFRKLKGFAERVAGGNLDMPLAMDRHNLFGAFTESFDIMRSELKKARLAEAQAQQSKKELVAKLSHDIKTPVASIKAVSEVGLAVATTEKDKANYTQIMGKADQINKLVTNLFTATLEELQQLTVTPTNIESKQVKTMLENADYLRRSIIPDMPDCLVFADALRLQQVFDNIFANSYKYANTEITVSLHRTDKHIDITIEDFGGGVEAEELPVLKEKFKRGSNAKNTEGAGLGLYISDYFMKEMHGELIIENGVHGLKVTVSVPLGGKI